MGKKLRKKASSFREKLSRFFCWSAKMVDDGDVQGESVQMPRQQQQQQDLMMALEAPVEMQAGARELSRCQIASLIARDMIERGFSISDLDMYMDRLHDKIAVPVRADLPVFELPTASLRAGPTTSHAVQTPPVRAVSASASSVMAPPVRAVSASASSVEASHVRAVSIPVGASRSFPASSPVVPTATSKSQMAKSIVQQMTKTGVSLSDLDRYMDSVHMAVPVRVDLPVFELPAAPVRTVSALSGSVLSPVSALNGSIPLLVVPSASRSIPAVLTAPCASDAASKAFPVLAKAVPSQAKAVSEPVSSAIPEEVQTALTCFRHIPNGQSKSQAANFIVEHVTGGAVSFLGIDDFIEGFNRDIAPASLRATISIPPRALTAPFRAGAVSASAAVTAPLQRRPSVPISTAHRAVTAPDSAALPPPLVASAPFRAGAVATPAALAPLQPISVIDAPVAVAPISAAPRATWVPPSALAAPDRAITTLTSAFGAPARSAAASLPIFVPGRPSDVTPPTTIPAHIQAALARLQAALPSLQSVTDLDAFLSFDFSGIVPPRHNLPIFELASAPRSTSQTSVVDNTGEPSRSIQKDPWTVSEIQEEIKQQVRKTPKAVKFHNGPLTSYSNGSTRFEDRAESSRENAMTKRETEGESDMGPFMCCFSAAACGNSTPTDAVLEALLGLIPARQLRPLRSIQDV